MGLFLLRGVEQIAGGQGVRVAAGGGRAPAPSRRIRRWAWPWELKRRGVLGINRRNAAYVLPHNSRRGRVWVDDKLLTKQVCRRCGVAAAETFAVVARHGDVRRIEDLVGGRRRLVIKPCRGSEGRGIVVVTGRRGRRLVTAGGGELGLAELRYRLAATLAGLYSLGGQPDRAMIERFVPPHPVLARLAGCGAADVRVVLYRATPVMAMVRLPTRASGGRANLRQGAVGAGVALSTGVTMGGVWRNRTIDAHPDTGASLIGVALPWWPETVWAAVRLAEALPLGYLGVDFLLDAEQGPLVVEANARPGLSIQLANRSGLSARLARAERLAALGLDPGERLELVCGWRGRPEDERRRGARRPAALAGVG